MNDLGIGIGANYNDGNQRGEIEVFVSHKNHLTNWHYDFQHNFTIHLSLDINGGIYYQSMKTMVLFQMFIVEILRIIQITMILI